MSRFVLAAIVEGHGEVEALPVLVRRIRTDLDIVRPIRVKWQRIEREGELERYARIAEAAVRARGGRGAVFLVLDADEACAAALGPSLAARLRAALAQRTSACLLAVREFESWLVAGDAREPDAADEHRAGKRALQKRPGGYSESIDQPKLAAALDVDLAVRRSLSFRRFVARVRDLPSEELTPPRSPSPPPPPPRTAAPPPPPPA